MRVLQNYDARMRRREGYYPCKRGEMGIYRTSVVGGRLLLVTEYWWLTLCKCTEPCAPATFPWNPVQNGKLERK